MRKLYYILRLLGSFAIELVAANLAVARVVLAPRLHIRPGIVAYPLELRSETAITWLANLITLTPGTLTIDVSEDHKLLYIHTLNIADASEVIASIRQAFEVHLLEIER